MLKHSHLMLMPWNQCCVGCARLPSWSKANEPRGSWLFFTYAEASAIQKKQKWRFITYSDCFSIDLPLEETNQIPSKIIEWTGYIYIYGYLSLYVFRCSEWFSQQPKPLPGNPWTEPLSVLNNFAWQNNVASRVLEGNSWVFMQQHDGRRQRFPVGILGRSARGI